MSLFCNDRDLIIWEVEIFAAPAVKHLALVKNADATISGSTLATTGGKLAFVEPGMVTLSETGAGDTLVQCFSVVTASAGVDSVTLSVLRPDAEAEAPPAMQGAVKLTVVSFRALIETVSAEIAALLGVDPAITDLSGVLGLKPAAVFGTLAAIYRAIGPSANADKKLALYTRLYQLARRAVTGNIDLDGDGIAETQIHAGVTTLQRV